MLSLTPSPSHASVGARLAKYLIEAERGEAVMDPATKKLKSVAEDPRAIAAIRRHGFAAATAAAGGLSIHQIGQLLGHRNPSTTALYSDLLDDPASQASKLVGKMLTNAIKWALFSCLKLTGVLVIGWVSGDSRWA